MTKSNKINLLSIWLLITITSPLSVLSDEPQCASLQQAARSDAFELNQRIEDPLIPNTGDITNTIPSFAELSDMSLLTDDADAMKQFESMPTPPSAVAPLIMLHPNTDGLKLNTIEIAAISTSDCVPGLIESQGQQVVCTETPIGENPFKGNYVFRYYELQGDTITQVKEAYFSISSESFLPIHNKSLSLDGTPLEGKKLIARGLLVDVSPEGIIPPSDKPSYVSIQYMPTAHPSSSTSKADKFIYLPFSQAALSHTSANPSDSDYAQFTMNGNFARQKVHSAGSPIAHFAARYTLAEESNPATYIVSTCNELQDLENHNHQHVKLSSPDGIINCGGFTFNEGLHLTTPIIFDGNNVRIKDLYINAPALFLSMKSGSTIKNVVFENVYVRSSERTGLITNILVPASDGATTTIDNVHVVGEMNQIRGGSTQVGGFIGDVPPNTPVLIQDSTINAKVSGMEAWIGGMIGRARNTQIIRSSFTGQVSLTLPMPLWGGSDIGGLVGHAFENVTIRESFATGAVRGLWTTGGLVGGMYRNSRIEDSYFNGQVMGMQSGDPETGRGMGGLVGSMANSKIIRSYSAGSISGRSALGGIVGKASDLTEVSDSFTTSEIEVYPFEGENPFNPVGTAGRIAGEATQSKFYGNSYTPGENSCLHSGDGFPLNVDVSECNETSAILLLSAAHSENWDMNSVWRNLEVYLPILRNVAIAPEE